MTSEKRLISYDVLIAHLDSCIEQGKGLFKSVCVAIKCFVERMPTVDAVEVVHGRWISSGCGFDCCSKCRKVYADGYLTAMGIKPRAQFNYCPNCGAKMDGGAEDA